MHRPRSGYGAFSKLSFIFFLAVVILTGVVAGFTPLYDDDLVFANAWGCAEHTICPEENFNPFAYALEHRLLTNGRLGDMFTPLITMIPGWLYGSLYAICFGIILLQMMKLAKLSFYEVPWKCMWLSILCILLFPWIDVLYTRALFFNYFPAIIFTLTALSFFVRAKPVAGNALVGCVLASFLSGCWHELMPVVLLPSAVIYCILTKKTTRNQWIVAASMTLGMLMVVTSPSFFNRTNQLSALLFSDNRILMAKLYVGLLFGMAAVSILSLFLWKKGRKRRDDRTFVIALLLPIVPSACIMLSSLYETRMCLFALILSLIALFFSLPSENGINRLLSSVITIFTLMFSTAVLAQLIYTAINTAKVKEASEEIIRQAVRNPYSHIYYDLREIVANDRLTLYKTQGRGYINKLHTWDDFSDYTGYKYTFNVLPPQLKEFDIRKAEPVGSGKGYYYYDSCLLTDAPCDSTHYVYGRLHAAFEDGGMGSYHFMGTYFTDVTGKPLIYLLPYQPLMRHEKPKEIEITNYDLHSRVPEKK